MANITGKFIKEAFPDEYLIRSAYNGFSRAPLRELSKFFNLGAIIGYSAANFNIHKFKPKLYEKIVNKPISKLIISDVFDEIVYNFNPNLYEKIADKSISELVIPYIFYEILHDFNSSEIYNVNNVSKPYKNVFQWIYRAKWRGSTNNDTEFKDNPRYFNNVKKFPVFRFNQKDLNLDKKLNKTIGKKNLKQKVQSAETKELERIIADLRKNDKYSDWSPDNIYLEFAKMLNDYGACTLL